MANLTPAQLARKRVNDRAAQRAIRQRTKERIERLEREVADLKKLHDPEAMQALEERNKHLEGQVENLQYLLGLVQNESAAVLVQSGLLDSLLLDNGPGWI